MTNDKQLIYFLLWTVFLILTAFGSVLLMDLDLAKSSRVGWAMACFLMAGVSLGVFLALPARYKE